MILSNIEMSSYTNQEPNFPGIVQPSSNSNPENCFSQDIDSLDDDQISTVTQFDFVVEPTFQVSLPRNYKLLFTTPESIWQPPEIS